MKLATLLFTALIFIASCQPDQSTEAINDNEELVIKYFEHFNKHEWDKMAAMYVDTAEFKDPSLGTGIVMQTREQIAKKYGELAQIFPDVKDSVLNVYPSGQNHVIIEFLSTGTGPDSSKFELPLCTVFTFEKGLIKKDHTYYDNFEEPGK